MWAKHKQQSGFTIVELLIVIVVIGILAAITIVAYNGVQQRAKDTRRSSDVSHLKQLLELYKTDTGTYPSVCAGGDNIGCSTTTLASVLVPTYAATLPQDVNLSKPYQYVKGSGTESYAIYIQAYESVTPCKTGVNVSSGWWGAGVPIC
jgi:type II secretion system protein G